MIVIIALGKSTFFTPSSKKSLKLVGNPIFKFHLQLSCDSEAGEFLKFQHFLSFWF